MNPDTHDFGADVHGSGESTLSKKRPSHLFAVVALSAALAVTACGGGSPAAVDRKTERPIDRFCEEITDADNALRDLSTQTGPREMLAAATIHASNLPQGVLQDHANAVLRRLELIADIGITPLPRSEQDAVRVAMSEVSAECTANGWPLDLLRGASSN